MERQKKGSTEGSFGRLGVEYSVLKLKIDPERERKLARK